MRRRRIPRQAPGKPIKTRTINGLVDMASDLSKISATPPLQISDTPDGPQLSYGEAKGFWARLTGGSNPYSYQEVTWYGGAQHDVTGGRTGTTSVRPAYDVNGITTLPSGHVDFLRPGAPGEYVFQSVKYGSSGCGTGTIPFNVKGCSSANIPGVLVTLTGPGGYSASGTTDASGNVTFSIVGYPAGTYSYSAALAPYTTATGTKVATCSSNSTTNITLAVPSGYFCCGPCNVPLPTTINATSPFGTSMTMTRSGSGWVGTTTETVPVLGLAGACTQTTGSMSFSWFCSCSGFLSWSALAVGRGCPPGAIAFGCFGSDTGGIGSEGFYLRYPGNSCTGEITVIANIVASTTSGGLTCYPFYRSESYDWKFTYTDAFGNSYAWTYAIGTGTVYA